jgi:thioredoxin-like negative regulator of GroEL
MKKFITIISLLFAFAVNAQDITVIQFNAKWNSHNTNDNIEKIKRAEYKFAYLENQSPALQQSIKAVPTVVIYKDGKPVGVFEGDLTMTLRVRLEDIQAVVDKYID